MGKCFCDKLGRVEQEQKTIGFHLPSTITTNSTTGLLNLSYAYDNLGNIIRESDLSDKPLSPMPVENLHYVYEPSRPHVLKSLSDSVTANTIAYTTDPNGNMDVNNNPLTGVNRTFVYDINNMPTAIIDNGQVVANMEYDGNGARVRKYSPSGSETVYVNSLYECDQSGACTSYIFAGGTRIARKEGGTIFYIHQDHQGSTRVVTNAAGTNVEDIEYSPYGQITKDTQAGPYAEGYKFTSQLHDTETGLHYYNARYYDPYIGRFISADTIVPDPGNPQSFNRYAYVYNNPVNYVDPSGHWSVPGLKELEEWTNDTYQRNENQILGVGEMVGGAILIYTTPVCAACGSVGAVMMGHGAYRLGGQVNVDPKSNEHNVISWQDNPRNEGREYNPLITLGSTDIYFDNGYEKIWNSPNTAIGLLYGLAGLPFGAEIRFGNNAIQFINHPFQALFRIKDYSANGITFGNAISYSDNPLTLGIGNHERQHTYQGERLGPFYLPANAIGMVLGLIVNGNVHGYANFMEAGPLMEIPRPWQGSLPR